MLGVKEKLNYRKLVFSSKYFNKINLALSEFLKEFYQYNSQLKNTGYYLKPVHIVVKNGKNGKTKYYYYGRYWYKLVINRGGKSRIKWIYIGKNKPHPQLPDPLDNPLEGTVVKLREDHVEIIAPEKIYELISKALASAIGHEKLPQAQQEKRDH
jgi:hypothetical protein